MQDPHNQNSSPRPPRPDRDPNRPPGIPPGPGDQRPNPGGRFRIPSWVIAILVIGLAAWNVWTYLIPHNSQSRETLPYSVFLQQVTTGNVSSVSISSSDIQGDLKQPIVYNSDTGQATTSDNGTSKVQATLPPVDNPDLLATLTDNHVKITGERGETSFLTSLLFSSLPFLLFIILIFFMGRQMTRGQQNVFGFGRSRARMNDPERPQVTFADVAGEDEAKQELTEVVDFLRNPGKYHQLGARLPRGVLLVGPPGTGKTLTARAVAGEAGVPFFSISASEFVEMFVGVGASRVRDLFEKAKTSAPAIIFIDELDAVGRQRFAGLGGSNDEREQTLNQLLVEMDGFDTNQEVIVMAATNRPDVLDPALLRPGRFDRQVMVGLPDRTGREAILRIHSRGLPIAKDVDLGSIAKGTTGFAGADLANLVNEAALTAARHSKKEITSPDFEEALDKILLGTTRSGLMNEKEREVVAYHEAGHALVAHFTPGTDPVRKVTIVSRGRALGATLQMPDEDRHNYSRTYLLGRLATMLGGRAAEMIVYDEVTTGAENDLKEATSLARRMVGLWGMSDAVGPVYLGTGEQHVFLGREITQERAFSESTSERLDESVRDMVESGLQRAIDLNKRFRPQLDALVARLLEKETLDQHEVMEIFGPATPEDIDAGIVPRQPTTEPISSGVSPAE